ncbi:hypothetical protein [Kitasatospora sp. NPDC001095]
MTVATTRTDLREEWTITPGSWEDRTDRFPLFVAPPGWSATATGLTALSRDRTYLLSAADIVMDFTLADLDKLKRDEVLTIKGVGTTRMKPDKFRARALKSC